jgi:multiple sugar transport system permease protein
MTAVAEGSGFTSARARLLRPWSPKTPAWAAPLLFLSPAFVTLGLWIYWPLIEAFRLSFFEWNLNASMRGQ